MLKVPKRGRAIVTRVVRGGSWNNNQRNARCAYRNRNIPDNYNNNLGFRVVMSIAFGGRLDRVARRSPGRQTPSFTDEGRSPGRRRQIPARESQSGPAPVAPAVSSSGRPNIDGGSVVLPHPPASRGRGRPGHGPRSAARGEFSIVQLRGAPRTLHPGGGHP
jgi:hypothetical protein